MSDLIQRLRAWPMDRETANEAAAEIERLQREYDGLGQCLDRAHTHELQMQRQRDEAKAEVDRLTKAYEVVYDINRTAMRERDKDRAKFNACVDDMFDGMECDPECDSYGHTETCCSTNGTEAVKKLRRQRDEAIADAERYRFLRGIAGDNERLKLLEKIDPEPLTPEKFDAAIDAAVRLLNQKEGT